MANYDPPNAIPQAGFSVHSNIGRALTAAGTLQTDALALVNAVNEVTTTALNTGVRLPKLYPGTEIMVFNRGANGLNVWPNTGASIDAGAANAAAVVATVTNARFICVSATQWYRAP